jgi:YtcA family
MQKDHRMTRKLDSLSYGRPVRPVTVAACSAVMATVAGCSRVPSFNILGSFFPAWILCGVIGILLAVAVRFYFVRIKLEEQLKPLILVYPCLAAFFTFTLWLLFFS